MLHIGFWLSLWFAPDSTAGQVAKARKSVQSAATAAAIAAFTAVQPKMQTLQLLQNDFLIIAPIFLCMTTAQKIMCSFNGKSCLLTALK